MIGFLTVAPEVKEKGAQEMHGLTAGQASYKIQSLKGLHKSQTAKDKLEQED